MKKSFFVFPGAGKWGHIVSMQHPHEDAITDAGLEAFEFYCGRHTFGTRAAQSGMDRYSLARLMGHSSPAVAARYYIHVTETHVAAGFGKFVEYQTRATAEGLKEAFPKASTAVQQRFAKAVAHLVAHYLHDWLYVIDGISYALRFSILKPGFDSR